MLLGARSVLIVPLQYKIQSDISSRRRYREESVPRGLLCACGIRFSLLLGHARGKTTLSCFLTLSRRFATRAFWANGFQGIIHCRILEEINGRYSLRASPFSRWRFALLCRWQRLAEQSAWASLQASFQIRFHLIINRFSAFSLSQKTLFPDASKVFTSNTISNDFFRYCVRYFTSSCDFG